MGALIDFDSFSCCLYGGLDIGMVIAGRQVLAKLAAANNLIYEVFNMVNGENFGINFCRLAKTPDLSRHLGGKGDR